MRNSTRSKSAFVLVCLASLLLVSSCARRTSEMTERTKLTFALPVADWWTAAPFIVPESRSFFDKRGIDLSTLEVNSGLASKNAVVAGTADIGLSAATPLALAAAKHEGLVVLATYLRSSKIVGMIRPENVLATARPPEPVGIVPSTISEWYLYKYLARRGEQQLMERGALKELHLKPADIPNALKTGSARSAVIWEPFLSLSAEQPGLTIDRDSVDFQVQLYLITRPAVLRKNGAALKDFLESVEDACMHLRDHSQEAREQVERHFGFRPGFLSATWPNVDYRVRSSRPEMEAEILRDAEIAMALGYITTVPEVDYLFGDAPSR